MCSRDEFVEWTLGRSKSDNTTVHVLSKVKFMIPESKQSTRTEPYEYIVEVAAARTPAVALHQTKVDLKTIVPIPRQKSEPPVAPLPDPNSYKETFPINPHRDDNAKKLE